MKKLLKKLLLTACLLLACSCALAHEEDTQSLAVVEENSHNVTKISIEEKDIPVVKQVRVQTHMGYDDYCQALNSYQKALKVYKDVPKRTAAFEEALQAINLALNKEPENSLYWLLNAQIYRYRGGVPYAKNSFAKACHFYEQKLEEVPDSVSLNLQYAIACYAGDAKFYADYGSYKAKAVKYAKKALQSINETETQSEKKWILQLVEDDLVEQKFLTYVLLHDEKKLAKLAEQIKEKYAAGQPQYTMVMDYEKRVAAVNWYWKVDSKDGAEKAFLMYYLRDWAN